MVKLHFLNNQLWSDVSHIWPLWSSDDCLPSLYVLWPVAILFGCQGSIQFWKTDFCKWPLRNHWSSMTLIWYKSCLGKGYSNYDSLPLGLVAMVTESSHWLITGKWLNCIFYAPLQKKASVLCYTIWNFEGPSVCQGKHPRFRGYVWAILYIIMKYFNVYSV